MLLKKSRDHLRDFQGGYFQHGIPAFGYGLHMILVGIVLLIHALVPGVVYHLCFPVGDLLGREVQKENSVTFAFFALH